MLSLSTNFSDVLERTGSPEVRPLIKMTGRETGGEYNTKDFYFSTQYFEIVDSGTTYPVEGILQKTPKIRQKMNIKKAKASIGGFTLDINNYPGKQNLAFSEYLGDYSFYNRTAEIYLWVEGLTDISDCLKVYTGIIRKIKPKKSQVQFSIENSYGFIHKDLPQNRINITEYPGAPSDSINQLKPLVYGDHSFDNIKSTDPSKMTFDYKNNMVAGILTNKYSDASIFLVCDHESETLTTSDIWLYDGSTQRFLQVDPSGVTIYNPDANGNTVIEIGLDSDGFLTANDWWYPDNYTDYAQTGDASWTSPGKAVDRDIHSYSIFDNTIIHSHDNAFLRILFPDYDQKNYEKISAIDFYYRGIYFVYSGNDTDITYYMGGSGIDVLSPINLKTIPNVGTIYNVGNSELGYSTHRIELTNGTGTDTYKLTYNDESTTTLDETSSDATIKSAIEALTQFDTINISSFSSTDYWIEYKGGNLGETVETPSITDKSNDLTGTVTNVQEGLEVTTAMVSDYLDIKTDLAAGGETGARIGINIYAIYEKIQLKFDGLNLNRFNIFVSPKGKPDTSGIITGAAGSLIENPSHIAESLLRDELGLSTEIDTTAYDNVATELSGWKIAPAFQDKAEKSNALLQKLGEQANSYFYINAVNQITAETHYATETTDLENIPKSDVINFQVYTSSLKDLVNSLKINYTRSAKRNFQEQLTREDDATDTGSQDRYNAIQSKVINADYHNDATTVSLLANHYTQNDGGAFWSDVFPIIEFETADLRGTNYWQSGSFTPLLALELNDVITFDSTEWDDYLLCLGESWSGKQFKIFDITRTLTSLKIKAFQV